MVNGSVENIFNSLQRSEVHVFTNPVENDHRVIDGAEGAQFLNTLKRYLENPASLLI